MYMSYIGVFKDCIRWLHALKMISTKTVCLLFFVLNYVIRKRYYQDGIRLGRYG
jgi:hypothetical protein